MDTMNYVLVVNVGPVQGFIATARKTRDLWFGSWLLSELSIRAAEVIEHECGGTIISPARDRTAGGMMVNRITAVLDLSGLQVLDKLLLPKLIARLEEEWSHLDAPSTLGGLDPNVDAVAQLRDLPECVWAAVPISSDYKSARDEAEILIAARKTTRDFAPVTWGAPKAKSSLDGVRESVIPHEAYALADASPEERQRYHDELYRKYKAGPAERLSAVDLLKRHGGDKHPVPSTSHMAALPLVMRMEANVALVGAKVGDLLEALKKAGVDLQTLRDTLHDSAMVGGNDASFLFESRLTEDPLGKPLPQAQVDDAVSALRAFFKSLGPGWMTYPYYALLVADGDNMGVVVDAQETREQHGALSQALSAFALRAAEIVDSAAYRGLTVYTGGDDVLALLPVHTALACARQLHDEFHVALQEFRAVDPQGETVTPSLSVGIVIAHHLEPLSEVLRLGRAAEGAAKGIRVVDKSGVKEKDAIAVTLAKRSGANRTIAGRWASGIDQRLCDFVDMHLANSIPDGAGYELQTLHYRLGAIGANPSEELAVLEPFVRAEAARIVGRKMAQQGALPVAKEIKERLRTELDRAENINQVALELIVAGEIAKACAVAGLSHAPALAPKAAPTAAAMPVQTSAAGGPTNG